jgi:predicted nucleic acid-binding protein
MPLPVHVLDASVGVKWFRDEPGSDEALALLRRHVDSEIVIAVSSLFLYEVLAVVAREGSQEDVERIWGDLERVGLAVVPLGDELVAAAAAQKAALGCSLYDAFSAGLAQLLDAPLHSADARAHGAFPALHLTTGE